MAFLAYTSACIVGLMFILQELETWLSAYATLAMYFYPLMIQNKSTIPNNFHYKLGKIISTINVIAIDILFVYSVYYAFAMLGITAALSAWLMAPILIGVGVIGYFSQNKFYGSYIPKLFANFFSEKTDDKKNKLGYWESLKEFCCKKWVVATVISTICTVAMVIGMISVITNGAINGVFFLRHFIQGLCLVF